MFKKILTQSTRFLALLICLTATMPASRATYPSWNVDVDGHSYQPWVAYGASLFYVTQDNGYYYVMRWSPGITEDEFIIRGNYEANILYLTVHDGCLYVAGTMTSVANVDRGIDVNVHGVAKVDLATFTVTDAFSVTINPIPYAMVWDHNGVPYIGGISWTGSGAHYETNVFKKWSGSAWVTVGGGLYCEVSDQSGSRALATDGTNIYVGGTFLGTTNGSGTNLLSSRNLVKWNVDSASWSAVGVGVEPGTIGWVNGLALSGTDLLASGSFNNHNGVRRFTNPSGSSASIGTANSDTEDVVAVGGDFYLAGGFTSIGGITTTGIAKWSPSTGSWTALGSGLNDVAGHLTANVNSVFVSGSFTTAGGLSCPYNTARWQLNADTALSFTSDSLSGTSVSLNLAGIPNLPVVVQRLDFPSDTWVNQQTLTLNTSGTGSFSGSTTNGLGYFRARSIDGGSLSTNAFGSIVGSVPPGYWMVGNPFPPLNISDFFPTPIDAMNVYCWTNNNFTTASYIALLSSWSGDRGVAAGEGMLVNVPGTNNCAFHAYGLFNPNYFSRTLPTSFSLITSPLYHKYSGGSATQIDQFDSTNFGGLSSVPVNSSSNPKATAARNKAGVQNQYINYTLTTGGQWQTNSVNTTVPILIGEGLWIENRFGSSQTWSVSVPIW